MTEFKDAKGEILQIGDFVAFKDVWFNGFNFGRVERFTPKMVRVIGTDCRDTNRDPESLLKLEGPFVEEFMASKGFV